MNHRDILHLLRCASTDELQEQAQKTVLAHKGRHVFVRGLIEFSNICSRNCLYCGLRSPNRHLKRYRLDPDEIVQAAKQAVAAGADSIVLQSGENACDAHWLAELVCELDRTLAVPVTLSVGERPAADYELWRKSGASRYLLKHETADAALYAKLHPGYSLQDRIACLKILASLGYEVGSGFMIGLPDQTLETIASDILLCSELNVAMAGIGPFIPHTATPLGNCPCGSAQLTLRAISMLRLALPNANLPATTALATVDPACGQKNGLMAGANVLMPSFTPSAHAREYSIYEGKNRVAVADAARAIAAAGRTHKLNIY